MGAESLSRRRIAVIASGRDNKHVSLGELNPVKVRAEANSDFKQHAFIDQYMWTSRRELARWADADDRSSPSEVAARLQQ